MPRIAPTYEPVTAEQIAAAVPKAHTTTAYENDPRVEQDGWGGLHVTAANGFRYRVVDQGVSGWAIFTPTGRLVKLMGRTPAIGFYGPDEAIFRVIGGPQ